MPRALLALKLQTLYTNPSTLVILNCGYKIESLGCSLKLLMHQ